jgi:hypothetical protein
LTGYNLPAVKVNSRTLDFGICPPFETRSVTFNITNLIAIECSIVLVIKQSKNSSTFQVPFSQIVLPANQAKLITISATPDQEGEYNEKLIVVAAGGQLIQIDLKVACGQSVTILETFLNVGYTDIFFDSVKKRINLKNNSKTAKVPVTFEVSSTDLIINNGELLVLEPDEERAVEVRFLSCMSGEREELITVRAPNMHPWNIKVTAISGPPVRVPVWDDLFLPAAYVGQSPHVQFPVINTLLEAASVFIHYPSGAPIKLECLPLNFSNSHDEELSAKPFSQDKWDGIKLIIPARTTVTVELAFKYVRKGHLKVPLKFLQLKPYKELLTTINILGNALNSAILATEMTSGQTMLQYHRYPLLLPMTNILEFKNPETAIKKNDSDVFQITPAQKTVFGSTSQFRTTDSLDIINLINVTTETQRYRIMLSNVFSTDISLEGELPGKAMLDIPIRFDPLIVRNLENQEFTAFGSITVFDGNFKNPGFVAAQIVGIAGELICMEVRESHDRIKFPSINQGETTTREMLVRNKSLKSLDYEIKIEWDPDNIPKDHKIPNPLKINKMSGTLKPFEATFLKLSAAGLDLGEWFPRFLLNYRNPNYFEGQGNTQIKTAGRFTCHVTVGVPEMVAMTNCIDFGDTPIGTSEMQTLDFTNNSAIKATSWIEFPEDVNRHNTIFVVPEKSVNCISLHFRPSIPRNLQYQLTMNAGTSTQTISLIGSSGYYSLAVENVVLKVTDDLTSLTDFEPLEEHIYNLGDLSFSSVSNKMLKLRNVGTMDVLLAEQVENVDTASKIITVDAFGHNSQYLNNYFDYDKADENETDFDVEFYNSTPSSIHAIEQYNSAKPPHGTSQRSNSIVARTGKYFKALQLKPEKYLAATVNIESKTKSNPFPAPIPPFGEIPLLVTANADTSVILTNFRVNF